MFKAMLHRTLNYILEHKSTRKMIENAFTKALENPTIRKAFEEVMEQVISEYAIKTGYKL